MNQRYDGSSIDLERELVRYMAEHRISRRQLLERMAAVGVTAALAPVIAACTSGGASTAPSASARRRVARSATRRRPRVPPRRRSRRPEGELLIYNCAEYMARRSSSSSRTSTASRSPRLTSTPYDVMYAQAPARQRGLRPDVPDRHRHPGVRRAGRSSQELDQSLIPNVKNLAAEWADPEYDPGNKHSMPYMWWTTGFAYDTEKITGDLTSCKALWDPAVQRAHHDARRPAGGLRGGADPARLSTSTRPTTPSSTRRWRCSRSRSRCYGRTRATRSPTFKSGNIWIGQDWSGDIGAGPGDATVGQVRPARGGRRQRLRRGGRSAGRTASDRRDALHQPLLDARGQCQEHEHRRTTWGRTRRPRSSSTRTCSRTRRSTRTRRSSTSCRSCSTRARTSRSTRSDGPSFGRGLAAAESGRTARAGDRGAPCVTG